MILNAFYKVKLLYLKFVLNDLLYWYEPCPQAATHQARKRGALGPNATGEPSMANRLGGWRHSLSRGTVDWKRGSLHYSPLLSSKTHWQFLRRRVTVNDAHNSFQSQVVRLFRLRHFILALLNFHLQLLNVCFGCIKPSADFLFLLKGLELLVWNVKQCFLDGNGRVDFFQGVLVVFLDINNNITAKEIKLQYKR